MQASEVAGAIRDTAASAADTTGEGAMREKMGRLTLDEARGQLGANDELTERGVAGAAAQVAEAGWCVVVQHITCVAVESVMS